MKYIIAFILCMFISICIVDGCPFAQEPIKQANVTLEQRDTQRDKRIKELEKQVSIEELRQLRRWYKTMLKAIIKQKGDK